MISARYGVNRQNVGQYGGEVLRVRLNCPDYNLVRSKSEGANSKVERSERGVCGKALRPRQSHSPASEHIRSMSS